MKHAVLTKSFRAPDLGVESWYSTDLGDLKLVSLERFSGHLILAPIIVRGQDIWITVPYDHVSILLSLDQKLSILKLQLQEKAEVDLDDSD